MGAGDLVAGGWVATAVGEGDELGVGGGDAVGVALGALVAVSDGDGDVATIGSGAQATTTEAHRAVRSRTMSRRRSLSSLTDRRGARSVYRTVISVYRPRSFIHAPPSTTPRSGSRYVPGSAPFTAKVNVAVPPGGTMSSA